MFSTDDINVGSNIDWAKLAQQWIQMQNTNIDNEPEPPPPPKIGIDYNYKIANNFEEQGEAEMEVEMDDDFDDSRASTSTSMKSESRHDMLHETHWLNKHITDSNDVSNGSKQKSWNQVWTNPPPAVAHADIRNPTAHIPSLLKIHVPNPLEARIYEKDAQNDNLNAAQRKILPAWIRDGLEKMEREKLKSKTDIKKSPTSHSLNDNQLISKNDLTHKQIVNQKKIFENLANDDSTGSDDDDMAKYFDGKNINNNSTVSGNEADNLPDLNKQLDVGKTYEQKLNDLMVVVRRTLTELLLEVTNKEISIIALETVKACKQTATSAQVIRKTAVSSISNQLGLTAYDDSTSEDDTDNAADADNNADTEEELKSVIRIKKRTFEKVIEEIEQKVAAKAIHEEEKLNIYKQLEKKDFKGKNNDSDNDEEQQNIDTKAYKTKFSMSGNVGSDTTGKNNEKDFGETPDSKYSQHVNGANQRRAALQRRERTTRFSDNKDSKSSKTRLSLLPQVNTNAGNSKTLLNEQLSNVVSIPATLIPNPNVYRQETVGNLNMQYNVANSNNNSSHQEGIRNVMNAAEKAFEKAISSQYGSKRSRHSSSDNSSNSESISSRASKYSRQSSSSRHKYDHNSSSSHKSSRYYRERSSDTDDDYQNQHHHRHRHTSSRHRYDSKHSSHRRHHSRTRSRSKSRSSSRRKH